MNVGDFTVRNLGVDPLRRTPSESVDLKAIVSKFKASPEDVTARFGMCTELFEQAQSMNSRNPQDTNASKLVLLGDLLFRSVASMCKSPEEGVNLRQSMFEWGEKNAFAEVLWAKASRINNIFQPQTSTDLWDQIDKLTGNRPQSQGSDVE